MTDKILKEEMPNVNIGYPNEKRLFDAKLIAEKLSEVIVMKRNK